MIMVDRAKSQLYVCYHEGREKKKGKRYRFKNPNLARGDHVVSVKQHRELREKFKAARRNFVVRAGR